MEIRDSRRVDDFGGFTGFRAFFNAELAPYPGRTSTVARIVVAATLAMLLIMTFRIPGGALGTLYPFLIARSNFRSTLRSAMEILVSFTVGVTSIVVGAMFFADQPVTRFMWFVSCMFAIFFAYQILENINLATGFAVILVNVIPIWQIPTTAETRLELTLWQALAVIVGTGVTIVVELAYRATCGKEGVTDAIDQRLAITQRIIEDLGNRRVPNDNELQRLILYAVTGVGDLCRTISKELAGAKGHNQLFTTAALVGRLVDYLAAFVQIRPVLVAGDASGFVEFAKCIAHLRINLSRNANERLPLGTPACKFQDLMLEQMWTLLGRIESVMSGNGLIERDRTHRSAEGVEPQTFLHADAFRNPEYLRFALKGCLAATLCYVTYEVLDWRGIATAVTTCVITALSTIGATRQKQLLRFTGALAGGLVLGMGSQIFVLPYIDSIGGFAVLFVAVTAAAAWCATSSPRLAYFGIQMAVAFYLVNIQDPFIETSLTIARDRVMGIMLGLMVMWLVFDHLGAKSAVTEMIEALREAIRDLAKLAIQQGDPKERDQMILEQLRKRISTRFEMVHTLGDAVPFELGNRQARSAAGSNEIINLMEQARSVYILEVALFQLRLDNSKGLQSAFKDTQANFNALCADVLIQISHHPESNSMAVTSKLDSALDNLRSNIVSESRHARAESIVELSDSVGRRLKALAREATESNAWTSELTAKLRSEQSMGA